MKRFLALFLILPSFSTTAQQGGNVLQHFQTGQQMRQAWDARKAAKDTARQAEEDERFVVEMRLAYNTPSLVLVNRNGLPDIRLSDVAANDCTSSFKAAFTLDARGKIVAGCASLGATKLHVMWHSYGAKTYQLSEWEPKQPLDSDHAPLGSQ